MALDKEKIKTIEELALLNQREFQAVHKEIENLASMTHREFLSTHRQLEGLINEVAEIKADLENIKLRLGEVAFRFEIQEVERRLRRVEIKLGMERN